ncbi:MAG: efflux transporter outer membrane subunit [Alphaproteobacteria bacterium]|nr:efflux transporter outer membrane subunit [Alphaproteobacteria bacterium]
MKTYKMLLMTSVVLLSSCTVGPDYKRPQFYSDNQIATRLGVNDEKSPINKEWYLQFNDPILNTLIARGQSNSPSVNVAIYKLRQSRQNLKINMTENLPMLDSASSYNYSKDNNSALSKTDYYQLGFDASWELDIWGGGRRLNEQSLALVVSSAANLDNVRLSLTAEIANNYFLLRQFQQQLQIANKNLLLQQEIFDLVKQKNEVGLADEITLEQAKYVLENTRSQIPQLEAGIVSYKNALTTLVGSLSGDLDDLLDNPNNNIVASLYSFDMENLYNLPVSSIRNRPDVRVAEANLVAQNAAIGQAIASMFPSLSLKAFFGWQSANMSNLISSKKDAYSYSPTINMPLFHWGALYNNVLLQKYLKAEQLEVYRESLITAVADVKNAITSVQKEYERNQSTLQALKSQEDVAYLSLEKYKQGLLAFSDVLTSQQNLLSAQNANITSNAEVLSNIISFYKSIGGGYSIPVDDTQ